MSDDFFDYTMLNMFKEFSTEGDGAVKEIISAYLDDAPTHLNSIKVAIAQENPRQLDDAAHSLKSASANLGAIQLSQQCQGVENLGRSGTIEGAQQKIEAMEVSFNKVRALLEQELATI